MVQLKRLRYCPTTVEAKTKLILAKTFAAAMHGVEAAEVQPAKFAGLTAAVIDTFRSRNDNHNTDRFFATLSEETKDLDPVVQSFGGRAMQIRRTCCKNDKAEARFKQTLIKHANRHKQNGEWPKWFHDSDGKESKMLET